MTYDIIDFIAIFLAIIIAMPLHEFAHAFIAVKCGDYTPKAHGRLTLNPMAHFDILGLIMLAVARFGWAKPVPINPYNFKHLRRDYFFVSIAGVVANYLLAFVAYPLFLLSMIGSQFIVGAPLFGTLAYELLETTLFYTFSLCINLFVFNLIPVYPLDGFRVVEVIAKRPNKFVNFLKKYGYYILLVLILIDVLAERIFILQYINLFGFLMTTLTGLVGFPIQLFWNFIFGLFK